MSQKDEPELVTSRPYHLVRHPIYSGILAAGIGTAVALSWTWLVPVVVSGVYCIYSATVEELHDRAVPGRVPGVSAIEQDAHSLRVLNGRGGGAIGRPIRLALERSALDQDQHTEAEIEPRQE